MLPLAISSNSAISSEIEICFKNKLIRMVYKQFLKVRRKTVRHFNSLWRTGNSIRKTLKVWQHWNATIITERQAVLLFLFEIFEVNFTGKMDSDCEYSSIYAARYFTWGTLLYPFDYPLAVTKLGFCKLKAARKQVLHGFYFKIAFQYMLLIKNTCF